MGTFIYLSLFHQPQLHEVTIVVMSTLQMGVEKDTVQLEKLGDKCQNTPKVPLFSTPEQPHLT